MPRMRATLVRSPLDRELHREIATAVRHVTRAQDVCFRVSRSRDPALQAEVKRAQIALKTLQQVRTLLDKVGSLTPNYDRDDPDLMPEAVREMQFQEQQEAERQKKQAERKAKKRESPEQRIRSALAEMRDQDGEEQ